MHRIDGPGAVNNLFSAGDPAVPQMATVVTPEWLNDVQENIARAILAAGIDLVKGDYNQLAQAIQAQTVGSIREVYAGMIVQWEAEAIPTLSDGLPLGLELDGAVADLSVYPRLSRKLCTEALNATAPAWYRCTPSGVRDIQGGSIRLQDRRGEYARGWDHGRGVDPGRALATAQGGTSLNACVLYYDTNPGSGMMVDFYNLDSQTNVWLSSANSAAATARIPVKTGVARVRNIATSYLVLV